MGPTDRLLARLRAHNGREPARSGDGWTARCPAHDDDAPSLSVGEGRDGRALVKCHAGCEPAAVVAALGLSLPDLFPSDGATAPEEPAPPQAPRPAEGGDSKGKGKRRGLGREAAAYDYFDADGVLAFQVVRFDPKAFRQRHPDGRGGWAWGRGGHDPILYRLPEAEAAARDGRAVFVVEGEKDADRLAALGLVATCNCGGASRDGDRPKWSPELHAAPLAGAHVAVLPDADGAGRAHAEAVARSLVGLAASVRVVALPGLGPKGDVSDWLDAGGTADRLRQLAREAPPYVPAPPVPIDVGDVSADTPGEPAPLGVCLADVEAEAVRWMWAGWLARGKVHVFDGDPGMGKSTLLSALAASVTAGVPWPDGSPVSASAGGGVVILTAEDDPGTTIRPRMEAAGADVARVSVVATIPTPNGHGRIPTLPADVPLVIGECRRIGARLLVIDPVTAYLGDVNSHRDSDVRGALAPLAAGAEAAGVAVVLVRHLNKGAGGSALYRGGGSIAFSGLARVVWIAGKDPADPDRRALAVSKNNLAAFPETVGYELVSAGPFGVGKVRWLGSLGLSADDLVRPPGGEAPTPAQDAAADFLLDALADGPRLARELYAEAEAAGIAKKTLKRAKDRLGVGSKKVGGAGSSGAWSWLPPGPKGAKDSIPGPLSGAGGDGAAGNGPDGAEKPKGVNPTAPLGSVAPLNGRGPLSDPWEDEDPT